MHRFWEAPFFVVAVIFLWSDSAQADTVPPQLRNKTISVSYTSIATVMTPRGERRNSTTSVQRLIYVSTAGRFFVRASYNSRTSEAAPGDNTPGGGARDWIFSGGRIIGFGEKDAGAGRVIISFDRGYQSCSASVLYGKPRGQHITVKRRGVTFELLEVKHSGEACSIREGNAFAR